MTIKHVRMITMTENKYGILGGYGAVATLRFQQLLFQAVLETGKYEDQDFPKLIITNLPTPVITNTGKIDDVTKLRSMFNDVAPIFRTATHMAVLCNTFHSEQPYMQAIFNGLLLPLPEITLQAAVSRGAKNSFLLASEETIRHNLYLDKGMAIHAAAAPELIQAGMQGNTYHPKLMDVIRDAEAAQADSIILGCTDLSIFSETLRSLTSIPVVDSLEETAHTILALEKRKLA